MQFFNIVALLIRQKKISEVSEEVINNTSTTTSVQSLHSISSPVDVNLTFNSVSGQYNMYDDLPPSYYEAEQTKFMTELGQTEGQTEVR